MDMTAVLSRIACFLGRMLSPQDGCHSLPQISSDNSVVSHTTLSSRPRRRSPCRLALGGCVVEGREFPVLSTMVKAEVPSRDAERGRGAEGLLL